MPATSSLTLSLARLRAVRWRRQERSWGIGMLKALFGLYVAFLLTFFGWNAKTAAILYAGQSEPLGLLHDFVAPAWATLFVLRYLTQSGLAGSLAPYLMLPIDRRGLVQRMTALDLLNLHTGLPMLFVGAFAISTLAGPFGAGTATVWATLLLLSLVCADLLCRWLRLRPWRFAEVRWALIGVGAVIALDLLTTQYLPTLVRIQLDATLFGSVAPLAGLTVATLLLFRAVTYGQYHALLHPEATRPRALSLGRFVAGRPVRSALRLELLLVIRHRRTRQLVLSSLAFAFVYPLILGGSESIGLGFAMGFLASGVVAFNYGPLMFGWEGRSFDGLLVRPTLLRDLLAAKVALLGLSVVGVVLVATPLFWLLRPHLVFPTLAAGLYVLGIGIPLTVGVATTNRTALDLSGSMLFNYQGITGKQMVGGAIIGLPAFGIVIVWKTAGLWIVAGLGVLGLMLMPLTLRLLTRRFARVRHQMAASFRATV